jgi:hypothetical protein
MENKLILQVEEEVDITSYGDTLAGNTCVIRQWRDAKWTDGELKWKIK